MRNVDIIYKAKSLVNDAKKVMVPVFLFIGLITVVPSLTEVPVIVLLLSLILLPITQGYITSTFKVYDGNAESVETYEDGMYGLKNWLNLFSTYFMYNLIKILIFTVEGILLALIFSALFYNQLEVFINTCYEFISLLESSAVITNELLYMAMSILGMSFLFLLPFCIIFITTNIVYDLNYFPTYYLLEEDGLKGLSAMKKARRMMKGHKKQLFLLKLSFIGWIIFSFVILVFISLILEIMISDINLLTMLISIIYPIILVFLYTMNYQMALTVFYKDIVREEATISYINEFNQYETVHETYNNEDEIDEIADDFHDHFSSKQLILGLFVFLPLYFVVGKYIISFLFQIFIELFSWTDMNVINAWYNFVLDGLLLLLGMIMFSNVFKSAWAYFKSLGLATIGKLSLVGYGSIYIISLITNLIVQLIDSGSESANQVGIETILEACPIPMIIAVVVFAPLLEELIFRGIIYRFVRKINWVLAMVVSGFLFGFIHVSSAVFAGDISQLLQILPYMAMGMVFSYFYEKSKSIAVPMYLHFLNNFISIIVVFFLG